MKSKNKQYFYENFASDFDSIVNKYDTEKRLAVFFDELLPKILSGKKLLDAGCGTGWFSAEAVKRGARVTSLDLGEKLLEQVAKKCTSKRVVGSVLALPFKDNSFDILISSEVIEHTTDPVKAIQEFYRVLKPKGTLVVSTPNSFWYFALRIATWLHIRPYLGYENWQSYKELRTNLLSSKFKIKKMYGIHAFPFVVPFLNPILNFLHQFRYVLGPYMVNLVVKCQK